VKGSDFKKFGAKKAPPRKLAGMTAAPSNGSLPALPTDGVSDEKKAPVLKAGASKRLAGLRR